MSIDYLIQVAEAFSNEPFVHNNNLLASDSTIFFYPGPTHVCIEYTSLGINDFERAVELSLQLHEDATKSFSGYARMMGLKLLDAVVRTNTSKDSRHYNTLTITVSF